MKTAGIVLCGGHSKRMGRPKADLPFGRQNLLSRVIERVGQAVSQVVVVAAAHQEFGSFPPTARLIRDQVLDRGPLGGLSAGLASIIEEYEAAFLSSCDSPFVEPLFIRRLFDLLGADAVCVPYVEDHLHPLAAVYRTSVLPAVHRQLELSQLRLIDLIDMVPTRFVREADLRDIDPELRTLRNVNTPEEYHQALREAGYE